MRSSLIAFLILVFMLTGAAEATATTRFVQKTGSDSSPCTSSSLPCATVGYAVEQAGEGDTIEIGAGTFTEAVSTEKVLSFVGQGAGSLPSVGAATVIQGPAGGLDEFGKTALRLRRGGTVEGIRLIGGQGGPAGSFGELGGDGIEYDANSAAGSGLSLQGVVAIGGPGGPGSTLQGSGGKGVDVRDGLGPALLRTAGSDFAGGEGFGPGIAVAIFGDMTTATVSGARIANDDTRGAGVVVFGGARVLLDQADVRSQGEGAVIYDGSLTVRNSRLHTGEWGLSVYPSSNESPELEVRDSLVVSDEQEALWVESEEGSPAVARVFGSTLIGHGYAAVKARHEAGEGPATVSLRNSVARHYPPADIVPRADLLADGGTIEAANSSFAAVRAENEGTVPDPGSGSNLADDPGFADPAGDVYVLQNTSPLIDRGDPGVVEAGEHDLLGSPRVLDGNRDCVAAPDIGAFEITGQEATCPDPPPTVFAFGISNKVFAPTGKVVKASATASARKVKRGTRFTYTLSEPVRIAIIIARKLPGRRLGRGPKSRCVKVTLTNRDKGKPCIRLVKRTTITAHEQAGRQSTPWNGRIGKKPAKPGRYRATILATDSSGQHSEPRYLSFKIVSAPR